VVNSETVSYTNSDFTDLKLIKYLHFSPHTLVEYNAYLVWFGLGWGGDPSIPVWNMFCEVFKPF
jgi:hypothetical protein